MITLSGTPVTAQSPVRARLLLRAWPWLAALTSGGLLTLGLEPWNQAWLSWMALTPLLAAVWAIGNRLPSMQAGTRWAHVRRQPSVRAFALGYLTGLVFFWTAFSWLWQVTGPGWFLLAPYMACYPAVWAVFMATVSLPRPLAPILSSRPEPRRFPSAGPDAQLAAASPFLRSRWNLWYALLGAAAWVALEWVRSWLLSGFGWNELGAGLHRVLPLIQIAEWTGVGGVSFLAAFVNIVALTTVYRFSAEIRLHRVRPHFDFTLTLAGLLCVFTFGIHLLQDSRHRAAVPGATALLRVAAVQPNIPQSDKWDPTEQTAIFKTFDQITTTALATRPDLLLWPEASTPRGIFGDRENYAFVKGIADRAHCNFLLGTLDYDFGEDGRSTSDYNAAVLLPRGAGDAQVYRKIHLVPFGEYVPYRRQFPPLAWAVGSQVPGDFGRGTEPVVFTTADPAVRLGPLICFEDTIGELARQPVLHGAQLLVNVTNDAWFGPTAASHQQLAEATFRTIENRRPLVRCANNGVTAFLDADGRVTQSLLMPDGTVFGAGVLSGEVAVPLQPVFTYYTLHGEVFSVLCVDLVVLVAMMTAWRKLRRMELQRRLRRAVALTEVAPEEAP